MTATTSVTQTATVYRFLGQVLNAGDFGAMAELVTPDYRFHGPVVPAPLDAAGHADFMRALRAAFPDWREEVVETVAEGDRVVTRVVGRGTHRGDFLGVPATGRSVVVEAVQIDRVAGGRIADRWLLADVAGLVRQLGADGSAPAAN
jgi:steroid delta-isomerase-like uncharacterized protein